MGHRVRGFGCASGRGCARLPSHDAAAGHVDDAAQLHSCRVLRHMRGAFTCLGRYRKLHITYVNNSCRLQAWWQP